jgi:hypothetical protein
MSDHEPIDPGEAPDEEATTNETSADAEWQRAGDDLKRLGAAFKGHYGEAEGEDPTDDIKEAARFLGRGLERFFGAVGESVKDPEVKATAKQAGSSFLDALATTFAQVGDEIGRAFDSSRSKRGETSAGSEDDDLEQATRELDDADLLDELKSDLAEDETPGTG